MVITNQLPDLPVTNPNTINIVRTSDFVQHVRPPPPGVPPDQYTALGSTRNDCILSGLVIVHLSKPKRARYLHVEHITTARLPASNKQLENPSAFKGWDNREVNRTAQISASIGPAGMKRWFEWHIDSGRKYALSRSAMAGCHLASKRDGVVRFRRRRHPHRCRASNASHSRLLDGHFGLLTLRARS